MTETPTLRELDLPGLPLSTQVSNYDPEAEAAKYQRNKELIATKYQYEKWTGERNADGSARLKKLSAVHRQWVACFINGMKQVEIAQQFGVAAITVHRVLSDPLAKELIEEFDDGFKAEFQAMFPLVSDTIRDGLDPERPMGTRLRAVDRYAKVARLVGGDDGQEGELRDKVAAVQGARSRLVSMIKTAKRELPDGTKEEVTTEQTSVVEEAVRL